VPIYGAGNLLSGRDAPVRLLGLLAQGHNYQTAAAALGGSVNTVGFHMKNIYIKLQVHSTSEAVAKALRHGIVRQSLYSLRTVPSGVIVKSDISGTNVRHPPSSIEATTLTGPRATARQNT
jgi:DNA-binding CsgD family transcriptional regulator